MLLFKAILIVTAVALPSSWASITISGSTGPGGGQVCSGNGDMGPCSTANTVGCKVDTSHTLDNGIPVLTGWKEECPGACTGEATGGAVKTVVITCSTADVTFRFEMAAGDNEFKTVQVTRSSSSTLQYLIKAGQTCTPETVGARKTIAKGISNVGVCIPPPAACTQPTITVPDIERRCPSTPGAAVEVVLPTPTITGDATGYYVTVTGGATPARLPPTSSLSVKPVVASPGKITMPTTCGTVEATYTVEGCGGASVTKNIVVSDPAREGVAVVLAADCPFSREGEEGPISFASSASLQGDTICGVKRDQSTSIDNCKVETTFIVSNACDVEIARLVQITSTVTTTSTTCPAR